MLENIIKNNVISMPGYDFSIKNIFMFDNVDVVYTFQSFGEGKRREHIKLWHLCFDFTICFKNFKFFYVF